MTAPDWLNNCGSDTNSVFGVDGNSQIPTTSQEADYAAAALFTAFCLSCALPHIYFGLSCRGGKDLARETQPEFEILAELKEQRENDRKLSVCKLPFLPLKFSWFNANGVFGRDERGE